MDELDKVVNGFVNIGVDAFSLGLSMGLDV